MDEPASEAELRAYRAELRTSIFRQIHARLAELREAGFTQDEMAATIGMQPSQLSRLLKGESDLQLETLSDLARGLGCRIVASVVPLRPRPREEKNFTYRRETGVASGKKITPATNAPLEELRRTVPHE